MRHIICLSSLSISTIATQKTAANFYGNNTDVQERLASENMIRSRAGVSHQSSAAAFGEEVLLDENGMESFSNCHVNGNDRLLSLT